MDAALEQKPITSFLSNWSNIVVNLQENFIPKYKKEIHLYKVNSKFSKLNNRRQKKYLKKAKHAILKGAYPVTTKNLDESSDLIVTFNYDQALHVDSNVEYNYFTLSNKKEIK